eukprot:3445575-Pleurochrysis_carterae.AAC.2
MDEEQQARVLARRHKKIRPERARAGRDADANGRDQPGRHRNDDRARRSYSGGSADQDARPKVAIADKLASQEGANSHALNADWHKATLGAHNVNDAVEVRAHAPATLSFLNTHARLCQWVLFCAQENFGRFDHVLHRFRGVSTESASGVTQQLKMHDFDEGDAASRVCAKE